MTRPDVVMRDGVSASRPLQTSRVDLIHPGPPMPARALRVGRAFTTICEGAVRQHEVDNLIAHSAAELIPRESDRRRALERTPNASPINHSLLRPRGGFASPSTTQNSSALLPSERRRCTLGRWSERRLQRSGFGDDPRVRSLRGLTQTSTERFSILSSLVGHPPGHHGPDVRRGNALRHARWSDPTRRLRRRSPALDRSRLTAAQHPGGRHRRHLRRDAGKQRGVRRVGGGPADAGARA